MDATNSHAEILRDCPAALADLSAMHGIHGEIQCDHATGPILVARGLAESHRGAYLALPLGVEVANLERSAWL